MYFGLTHSTGERNYYQQRKAKWTFSKWAEPVLFTRLTIAALCGKSLAQQFSASPVCLFPHLYCVFMSIQRQIPCIFLKVAVRNEETFSVCFCKYKILLYFGVMGLFLSIFISQSFVSRLKLSLSFSQTQSVGSREKEWAS